MGVGQSRKDQPSAMASSKPPPSSSESAIPDLEIAVSASRRLGELPRLRDAHSTAGSSVGVTRLLDQDLWGCDLEGALDIDVADGHDTGSRQPNRPEGDPWPSGMTPQPGSKPIESAQVDNLCSWGSQPKAWWQTVPYTFAVFFGRRTLLSETGASARALSIAEQRRDQRLAALGLTLLDVAACEPKLRMATDLVKAKATEYALAVNQQDAVTATGSAEVTALEHSLVGEQRQLQGLKSQLQHCQSDVENAELNLKREQARLTRLDIERRNLEQSCIEEQELRTRIEALSGQARSIAPRIEAAERALTSSRAALQHIAASTERSQMHSRELERLRDGQVRSQSHQLREVSSLSDEALSQRNDALVELGRAILAGNGRIAVDQPSLEQLRQHDHEIDEIWRRHQVFLCALDNYDRRSVKIGVVVVIGSALLCLAGLLYRIFN